MCRVSALHDSLGLYCVYMHFMCACMWYVSVCVCVCKCVAFFTLSPIRNLPWRIWLANSRIYGSLFFNPFFFFFFPPFF